MRNRVRKGNNEKKRKMKITDIQIGDWLQNTNGNIGKAQAIYRYLNPGDKEFGYEIIMQYNPNGTCYTELSLLKPIPLTAEILEKNGFESFPPCPPYPAGALRMWMNVKDIVEGIHMWFIKFFWAEEKSDSNEFRLEVFNSKKGSVKTTIKYIHELQHVLRLVEVDKEIVI